MAMFDLVMSRRVAYAWGVLAAAGLVSALLTARVYAAAPGSTDRDPDSLTLSTEAVGPHRYLAVHGRRALVSGYATSGLEVWAYPVQIVAGYEIGFRTQGAVTEISGAAICRRITYEPEAVTRTYIGPEFVVRERIFVPLNEAAAIVTYTVDSRQPVEIVVHFTPVLNVMWPAAIGGQSVNWNADLPGYVLSEPLRRFSGFIGSPDTIAHDPIFNAAYPAGSEDRPAFAVRAGGAMQPRSASIYLGMAEKDAPGPAALMKGLVNLRAQLEGEASAHYAELSARGLQITTPDHETNRALAWASIALDQAWVCNSYLGCGLVAGYGPSRDARRPQYAWFFAGDGLLATDALTDSGEYARAKQELEFVTKYQDAKSGMLWHELSQSAGLVDWVGKYPYMYVHVDITFDYLTTIGRYVQASGDTSFVKEHWASLEAAYRYCTSLLDKGDGLPRIPQAKEGGDEQDRLGDELELSSSWVLASRAFARLATIAGHAAEAEEARRSSETAQASLAKRYWDARHNSWIDGYNELGKPVVIKNIHGATLVNNHALGTQETESVLDQLASAEFQTDWGTRSVAADSPRYDPESYAKGSVWATGTAGSAETFWSEHRPYTAFPIWSTLTPWSFLDSLGHMDEVMAGDSYHQQTESVPEQTWSSAMFLSSAVRGLLGLDIDASAGQVKFIPHLPAQWNSLSVRNIQVPAGKLVLSLTRSKDGIELEAENDGPAITLSYAPEIPLGAQAITAAVNGSPVAVEREDYEQDTHAKLEIELARGVTRCSIHYKGGVAVSVSSPPLLVGESSKEIKITGVHLDGDTLVIRADAKAGNASAIDLRTTEGILGAEGAVVESVSEGLYKLSIARNPGEVQGDDSYRQVQVTVRLGRMTKGE